jgi:hypothetical protein
VKVVDDRAVFFLRVGSFTRADLRGFFCLKFLNNGVAFLVCKLPPLSRPLLIPVINGTGGHGFGKYIALAGITIHRLELQKGFFSLDAFCNHNGAKGMRDTQNGIDQTLSV